MKQIHGNFASGKRGNLFLIVFFAECHTAQNASHAAFIGKSAFVVIFVLKNRFVETTIAKPEQGLYLMLDAAGGRPVIALALFIGILFYVTSADSGALVMSSLSSRIKGEREDATP